MSADRIEELEGLVDDLTAERDGLRAELEWLRGQMAKVQKLATWDEEEAYEKRGQCEPSEDEMIEALTAIYVLAGVRMSNTCPGANDTTFEAKHACRPLVADGKLSTNARKGLNLPDSPPPITNESGGST